MSSYPPVASWPPVDGGGGGGGPTGPAGGFLGGTYPNPSAAATALTQIGGVPSGVDVNSSGQVVGTHLASALAIAQGGSSATTAAAARVNFNIDAIRVVNGTANVTVANTDRFVSFSGLTASRVCALPQVATCNPGQVLEIADSGGNALPTKTISFTPFAGDTIGGGSSTTPITLAGDSVFLMPDGGTNWIVLRKARAYFDCFGIHDHTIDLPTGVWTPIPLFTDESSDGTQTSLHPINAATTTIGAGSNTAVLPQGTINIANGGLAVLQAGAGGLPAAGSIVITLASGHDTVVNYAGTSAGTGPGGNDQFTGCTLGVGTLATAQVVRCANALINPGVLGIVGLMGTIGACVTFPAIGNTVGVLGVRLFSLLSLPMTGFAVGSNMIPNPNAGMTISVTPPSGPPGLGAAPGQIMAQMFQSSGATIAVAKDAIQAPSFGAGFWDV